MCRIGALTGDLRSAVRYVDEFRQLARTNGDGAGIGTMRADGTAVVHRSARSALDDPGFSLDSLPPDARAAVMHVRAATTGATTVENAHPFHVGEQVFAHNGTVGEVGRLEGLLGPDMQRLGVRGGTDSERVGALLERERAAAGGDVLEGYRRTVATLSDELPMTSLNSVSVRANGDVWALRYPENRTLFWKRQGARDAADGHRLLAGSVEEAAATARSESDAPLTIIASRPLDAEAGWHELKPGELLHVRGSDLRETITRVIDREPARRFVDPHMDAGAAWTGPRRATMVDADLGA